MKGLITNPSRKDWVDGMKKNASILDNKGEGDCALYALAMYFGIIFKEKYNNGEKENQFHYWFSFTYKLNKQDTDWADAAVFEQVNNQPISTKNNVNRYKFIKIYKCAVDADIQRAKNAENGDKNYFKLIMQKSRWHKNQSMKSVACQNMLLEILVLQRYMSLSGVGLRTGYLEVTPLDVKTETILVQKLHETKMYYSSHLKKLCEPRTYMSNYFIESVIKQVTADFRKSSDEQHKEIVFPYMFATKNSDSDAFIINFDAMHDAENNFSRIVFVHSNNNHWFLLAHFSYKENIAERTFASKNLASVNLWRFTQLVNEELKSIIDIETDNDEDAPNRNKRQASGKHEKNEKHKKMPKNEDSASSEGGSSSRGKSSAGGSSSHGNSSSDRKTVIDINSSDDEVDEKVVQISDTDSDIVEVPRKVPENAMIQDIMQRLYM
jgi:hypothetical protein